MPYFDHVRCHSCKAMLDPESLSGDAGLVCPRCGVALNLSDLFGLSDAFAEEEEGPVSLDDLVPASKPKPAAKPAAPKPAAATKPAAKANPAPSAPLALPGPAEPGSALEAMRSLKRKK